MEDQGLSQLSLRAQKHLQKLGRLPLDSAKMEPCYMCANLLLQRSDHLQSRFRFPHTRLVVQRAQSNMQEVTTLACVCTRVCRGLRALHAFT